MSNFPPTKLTAIVPVAFKLNVNDFSQMVSKATELGVRVILVHDVHKGELRHAINEISKLNKNCNFQIIEGEFNSPGFARNAGLKAANTEWITFWDADDKPNIEELMQLLAITAEKNANFGIGNFEVFNLKKNYPNGETQTVKHYSSLSEVALNPGLWRIIYRRERIKNLEFSQYLLGEDQLFFVQIAMKKNETQFSEKAVYEYHIGGISQLTSKSDNLSDLSGVRTKVYEIYKNSTSKESKLLTAIIYYRLLTTELKNAFQLNLLNPASRLLPRPWRFTFKALYSISNYSFRRAGKI